MTTNVRTAFAGSGGDVVKVCANGRVYRGWKSVTITRKLGGAASAFALDMSREPGLGGSDVPPDLVPGDQVEILINDIRMVTGFVEVLSPERGPDKNSRRVQGRSRTSLLVDSSASTDPGQYKGVTVSHLARILAKPFGIEVLAPADTGAPIPSFDIKQGEKVHAAIERAARNRGLELTDDAFGRLVILKPGATGRSAPRLEHIDGPAGGPSANNNVKVSRGRIDVSSRFAVIEIRTQQDPAPGQSIMQAATVSATARDPGAIPGKHLVILSDQQMSVLEAQAQARYEITRRAGQSIEYTPIVAGWRRVQDGQLWEINRRHAVKDTRQGFNTDMLVTETTFTLDSDNGHRTELTLQPPEAFASDPKDIQNVDVDQKWSRVAEQFKDE